MASISNSKPLRELLAEVLPKDTPFTFYHFSTPPTKSPALYSAPPHTKPERTYCESHFLAVSITSNPPNPTETAEEFLVLAIEVLIYSTKHLTTIFVSKADSTGCISTLDLPRSQSGSPLKTISGTFVSWLVRERQRPGKRLVVSLFARAQDQYLFPGSVENADKHVLDDRGLIKWWCRVLDPVVRDYAPEKESKSLAKRLADGASKSLESEHMKVDMEVDIEKDEDKTTAKGYLIIPGFDTHDMLRYIPSSPSPTSKPRWVATHPLLRLAPHPAAPPRCLIPHFPDDPKSRFLDELDEELPDHTGGAQGGTPSRSNGHWKSVKTLDQFWDMMSYRQECCSGRCVGFIWVVITPPHAPVKKEAEDESQSQSQSQSQPHLPPAPSNSQPTLASTTTSSPNRPRPTPRRRISTRSGPIPLRLPRIKSSTSTLSASQTPSSSSLASLEPHLPPVTTSYFHWPPASRGTLLFTTKHYARALDVLLQQNFTTRAAAARSSARWRDEVGVLAGMEGWGWSVVGRKEWGGKGGEAGAGAGSGDVNVLGVRKKRKVEGEAGGAVPVEQAHRGGGVRPNVLGAGLVRKKAKVEEGGAGAAQRGGEWD